MGGRYDLSDFDWSVIEPLLPNKPRGVPRVDDRRVLNGEPCALPVKLGTVMPLLGYRSAPPDSSRCTRRTPRRSATTEPSTSRATRPRWSR